MLNDSEVLLGNTQALVGFVGSEASTIKANIDEGFCVGEPEGPITLCKIVEELECKPVPVGKLSIGHGCDGVDNDCNNEVDDCGEDVTLPQVDFSQVTKFCSGDKNVFSSSLVAEECVGRFVVASDDCQEVSTTSTVSDVTSQSDKRISSCGRTYEVEITAMETQCFKSKTSSFLVLVQDNLRKGLPSCVLTSGPESPPALDLSAAKEHCAGKKFWQSLTSAINCVNEFLIASDPCRQVSVSVEPQESINLPGCSDTTFVELQVRKLESMRMPPELCPSPVSYCALTGYRQCSWVFVSLRQRSSPSHSGHKHCWFKLRVLFRTRYLPND